MLGTILLGAAVGCSKEEASDVPEGPFTLSVDLPENQTVVKTALGSNYEVLWKAGNTVSINGIVSTPVSDSDNGKRSASFTFKSTPSAPYNILYPGTTSTDTVVFPAEQNYVEGSFDDNATPAYGVATINNGAASAKLIQLNAVLRFAINGTSTISKIVLNTLGEESIAGKFKVNFSNGALTANGNNSASITYNICGDDGLALSAGSDKFFYLAVPARTYAEGFEALVYEKTTEKYMRLKFFGDGKTLPGGSLVEFGSKTFAAGRVEDLVQVNDFTAQDGGTPATQARFTVATYNLLSNHEGDRTEKAVLNLTNCGESLGKTVKATNADIICFNEIDETFATSSTQSIRKLAENQGMTGYTWYIQAPNKVVEKGFYPYTYEQEYTWANGFAFNSSVFETVGDVLCYWYRYKWQHVLSSDYYTSSAKAAHSDNLPKYRTFIHAKMRHKASGKTFNLLVTHLPNYNDVEQGETVVEGYFNEIAANVINVFLSDKGSNADWLLCGDMNAYDGTGGNSGKNHTGYQTLQEQWTDAYEQMRDDGTLSDFYEKYSGTQSGTNYYYGWQQYSNGHPERRVDHIMYHGNFKAEGYKTIRQTYNFDDGTVHSANESNEWCPSDHLPVVVNITLN